MTNSTTTKRLLLSVRKGVFLLGALTFSLSLSAQTPETTTVKHDWMRVLGGESKDNGSAIVTDAEGNIYTMGTFRGSSQFGDTTLHATVYDDPFEFEDDLPTDIFISKQTPKGEFTWVQHFKGGDNGNKGNHLNIDKDGNLLITGVFFDSLSNVQKTLYHDGMASFICKMTEEGEIVWTSVLTSSDYVNTTAIHSDSEGNILISGEYKGEISMEDHMLTKDNTNIFTIKLDDNGDLAYMKDLKGTGKAYNSSFTIDKTDNIYIAGEFEGNIDFSLSEKKHLAGTREPTSFVTKYNRFGEVVWQKTLGADQNSLIRDIAIDNLNQLYVVGCFRYNLDLSTPTKNIKLSSKGNKDSYIAKFNSFGNLVWAQQIGGTNSDNEALSVTVDHEGNIYTTGSFTRTVGFNSQINSYLLTANAASDVYISKLTPKGELVWAKQLGRQFLNQGVGITVDRFKNVYTTGNIISSTSFYTDDFTSQPIGNQDAFIHKMTQEEAQVISSCRIETTSQKNLVNLEVVTIQDTYADISIKNITGDEIYTATQKFLAKGLNTINLKNVFNKAPYGVYLVNISLNNGESIVERFVKNK